MCKTAKDAINYVWTWSILELHFHTLQYILYIILKAKINNSLKLNYFYPSVFQWRHEYKLKMNYSRKVMYFMNSDQVTSKHLLLKTFYGHFTNLIGVF
jgi:hypothetical protein